jgi:hypothetical protein
MCCVHAPVQDSPFLIVYTVSDSAGNRAVAFRRVVVLCADGELRAFAHVSDALLDCGPPCQATANPACVCVLVCCYMLCISVSMTRLRTTLPGHGRTRPQTQPYNSTQHGWAT